MEGSTETSAIFSGTGSEIVPKKVPKKAGKAKSTRKGGAIEIQERVGEKRKSNDRNDKFKRKSRKKIRKSHEMDSKIPLADDTAAVAVVAPDHAHTSSGATLTASVDSEQVVAEKSQESEAELEWNRDRGMELRHKAKGPVSVSLKGKTKLREVEHKKKRKKKKGKKPAEVDGARIEGLDYSSLFNPGEEDEEQSSKQDDFILHKLFKKSGKGETMNVYNQVGVNHSYAKELAHVPYEVPLL